MMTGALVVCCSPPKLQVGWDDPSSEKTRRQRGSSSSCGSSAGDPSGVVMRSCWLGEGREWQSGSHQGSSSRGGRNQKKNAPLRSLIRAGFEGLLHNPVLFSSTAAAVSGQLGKPLSSSLRGKGFNWRLIYTSGGMPSSHSAAVTAAATALALERGLSDSLFGVSVILACIVMYDAQGVRRAVGKQAEDINTMVLKSMVGSEPPQSKYKPSPSPYSIGAELARNPIQAELAFMEDADSSTYDSSKSTAVLSKETVNGLPSVPLRSESQVNGAIAGQRVILERAEELPSVKEGDVTLEEIGNSDGWRHIPLKENVGHTKVEVLVGVAWGFVTALALHSSIQ